MRSKLLNITAIQAFLAAVALFSGTIGTITQAAPPGASNQVAPADRTGFDEVHGGKYDPFQSPHSKAVVLIFFGHDCPISNRYAPEISRLQQEYSAEGVELCLVYADPDLSRADARKHAKDYSFDFPAILDPTLRLAARVGASVKPEAAVLSPDGEVLYRGRIDNTYADLGKGRATATQRDLRAALDSILAGEPVAVPRTQAIGCDIDFSSLKNN
jgi:thiol-disulfide isomerase/thioredoxin